MTRHDIPKSFRFQPEEIEMLERQAEKHGGAKAAVIAGLRALEDGGSGDAIRADIASRLRSMAYSIEPTKPKGKRK